MVAVPQGSPGCLGKTKEERSLKTPMGVKGSIGREA